MTSTPAQHYKNIAIWGFGREGRAALSYIQRKYKNAEITIIDKAVPPDSFGHAFLVENDALSRIAQGDFDLIVKSPGISLYNPALQEGIKNGSVLTSGTNLWFEAYPDAPVIVVTGTKGKSTTASLLHHLAQKSGLHSVLAGNIGTPLLETKPGRDITVLELSSYQIADLHYYPEIVVITNLLEAHLEWHGDKATYHRDKMRICDLSPDTTVLFHKDDKTVEKYLGDRDNVYTYSSNTGDLIIPDFLSKPHNLRNISAAMTALETLNALSHLPTNALEDFKPLPHRQEVLGTRDGITYINDSISTVPETAVIALAAFADKPVALILGGEEKGQDFSCVWDAVNKRGDVQVFCIPDSGIRLAQEFEDAVLCADMKDAVLKAQVAMSAGGYIILSPGTPSFPLYKNYMERGADFSKLCGF